MQKRDSRGLRSILLALTFLAVTFAGISVTDAQDEELPDQFGQIDIVELIAYPFLPYGETIDGHGPWYGSVTIQNVESSDVRIWVLADAGFDVERALGTYVLPPNGSITLSAAALGLEEAGSPLVVAGMYRAVWDAPPELREDVINEMCDVSLSGVQDAPGWVATCKPSIAGIARIVAPEPLSGASGSRTSAAHISVDGYNAIPAQDIAWGSQSAFCEAIVAGWPDECSGIGTYEPFGYGVGFVFDGHSYLPIVQTNSGWNTEIRISNIDPSVWAGQVNVTLISSNQQGHASSDDHQMTFEQTLQPGQSWALDLRASGVPEDWVGSAHITSNVGVVAYAARSKPEDDMLMVNVAAPSTWATTSPVGNHNHLPGSDAALSATDGRHHMYAPLVFRDYFGWNTGISIANIDEAPNRVSITWHDADGSMRGLDSRSIPARGQTYVYIPGFDSGPDDQGWVGAVTLSGDHPFHATIDQVKYETGEAMSYMATAAGASAHEDSHPAGIGSETLSLPLLSKGLTDGTGDTSGVQLYNADPAHEVEIEIWLHSPVGDLLPPTNIAPFRATIRPRGHYTLYTMDQPNIIPNSTGSVRVDIVDGQGTVFGVSNAVNYAVSGDGSAAFNLVNAHGQYRFPLSQTELP
jgi:hypothetical protein